MVKDKVATPGLARRRIFALSFQTFKCKRKTFFSRKKPVKMNLFFCSNSFVEKYENFVSYIPLHKPYQQYPTTYPASPSHPTHPLSHLTSTQIPNSCPPYKMCTFLLQIVIVTGRKTNNLRPYYVFL